MAEEEEGKEAEAKVSCVSSVKILRKEAQER